MQLFLVLAFCSGPLALATAAKTPMDQTVELIESLVKQVERDGETEQASFDEYSCWCEKTLERKANDISSGKELIDEMDTLVKKLEGEIGSHTAEIDKLNKDIAKNAQTQQDATDLRMKEHNEYMSDRTESEQCIGALEAAIRVISGDASFKHGSLAKTFLQGSMHEAELLSVVAGVRRALSHKVTKQSMSSADIDVMRDFVTKPDDFVGKASNAMSAAQIGQNPFGDYAPQSTRIQGILKGMYDAFTADLEKDNADEADKQKSFQELMATTRQEESTLKATLEKQESDKASKTKKSTESQVLRDDTFADVKADGAFFEETKLACKTKATLWSVRTRLRTEELNGMQEAIRILSSLGAKAVFKNSTTTFLQLASVHKHTQGSSDRTKAYNKLRELAANYKSRGMAKIAMEVKSGGPFDKVIAMVDEMIALLRREEQEDIEHRDRCENSLNDNDNERGDLDHEISKTEKSLARMDREKSDLEDDIKKLEKEISDTTDDQRVLLKMRNEEERDFRQALKDDMDAAALLRQAIVALSKFYKKNKIPLPQLIQQGPEYKDDADKAPETSWSGSDYGGRQSESGGIMAILEMLVEDTEKEIKENRADDADAQEKYNKQNDALQATLDSQEETKANVEGQLGDLKEKIADYDAYEDEKTKDNKAAKATADSLATDCKWVKTHFDSRREKRKIEMQGLVDAKGFLAGVAAGNDPLPLA
jgi:phage shock protein A